MTSDMTTQNEATDIAYMRQALALAQRAADQGEVRAQYNLGIMYATGQGVPQDYVQAHMWFNLAVAPGNKGAV